MCHVLTPSLTHWVFWATVLRFLLLFQCKERILFTGDAIASNEILQMSGMRKRPANTSHYCIPRYVITCGFCPLRLCTCSEEEFQLLSQSYLQNTERLKAELLHQCEELLATQWRISSRLGQYYHLHYVKVRGKRGTKVTCQRRAEVQIRMLPFCSS